MAKINLFHLLIIGPLLLAIDYYGAGSPGVPDIGATWRKVLLAGLGFASLFILFFVPWPLAELGWTSWYNLISLSHYLLWVGLFGWIAYTGLRREDGMLDSWMYPVLRWLGTMVIGIHGCLLAVR